MILNENFAYLNFTLSETLIDNGDLSDAISHIEQAIEIYKQLDTDNYSICIGSKGTIHQALGDFDNALYFYNLYHSLSNELYLTAPNNQKRKRNLAVSYSYLGQIHQALGKLDKSLEFYNLQTKLLYELNEEAQDNDSFKNSLAISYQYMAYINQELGNLDKTLEYINCNCKLKTDKLSRIFVKIP